MFAENDKGLLVRISPVDRSEQVVVPQSLRAKILYLNHRPRFAAHPGGTRMLSTMRRTYHWLEMALDVYACVRDCVHCEKEKLALRKHALFLKLFPATRPLDQVAIDILGPLARTTQGNRSLLVISDRFWKLNKAVALRRISSYTVARAFCDHWVFTYGPPVCLLSDNGRQFSAAFFREVYKRLGTKNLFTTAYHPQTNGQVERFNRTILAALRRFTSEDQRHWDVF